MTKIRLDQILDDDFDPGSGSARRDRVAGKRPAGPARTRLQEDVGLPSLAGETAFRPTLSASKHEREWILNYLGSFHAEGLIADVLRKVKGGKEANVYCCQGGPDSGLDLVAAKVYRPRMFRQLRQDARYRQGRQLLGPDGKEVRDWRLLHAVSRRTRFGQEVLHTSWLEHEFQTLARLHEAGADVPKPIARSGNTILMEYLGEIDEPAPALHEIRLDRAEARPLFDRVVRNLEIMLAGGWVHADLSAYNVLYWNGEIKFIDFPQAVDVFNNPDAPELFRRDVERVCSYFARYLKIPSAGDLAGRLWARHVGDRSAAGQARQRALEEIENRIED